MPGQCRSCRHYYAAAPGESYRSYGQPYCRHPAGTAITSLGCLNYGAAPTPPLEGRASMEPLPNCKDGKP